MLDLINAPRRLRSVLIANRGEIACRVIRTCRKLGLKTIAVYSEADATALHVRMADLARCIGPAAASQSYLNIAAIIDAARATGADAVHPGYGFLSENAAFAKACGEAGVIFIGPTPEVIDAMGSKINAKKLAVQAGVPTVPGYLGEDQSLERLAAEAERIGFPVLIKASAGGGGRGIRRVDSAAEMSSALQSAQAEAQGAFGDASVLLEKLITNPRHLEVQLIGDEHGNLVHLFERDCSVQRNNQKVFEEAPAPHLSSAIRDKLLGRAIQLGQTIGYTGAGTVEFIMEQDGDEPFFLEMNTRLQVEHPVTEAVTGVDLVEWQIAVASGLALPLKQDGIILKGHAIEARIAAERPDRAYQAATGTVSALIVPGDARIDAGIAEGSVVGLHYDSMIAKLIVHSPDRAAASSDLATALARFAVLGVGTNSAFLKDCAERPDFISGRLTTGFLAREFPEGWQPNPDALAALRAEAAYAWAKGMEGEGRNPWQRRSAFRVTAVARPAQLKVHMVDDYGETPVTLLQSVKGPLAQFEDGRRVTITGMVSVARAGDRLFAAAGGLSIDALIKAAIETIEDGADDTAGDNQLSAPLPGIITGVFIAAGAYVEQGASLIQMEAMKLVHTLVAPRSGRVTRIHCAFGETVPAGARLIDIESLEEV
jgi:3-methylcrotonyl-CoA carboxylase alpha subunit